MNSAPTVGLAAGLGICLWLVAGHRLGLHLARPVIGVATCLLSPLVLLAALALLRRLRQRAGLPGVGRDVQAGLHASFIAGAIAGIFLIGYSQLVNPGWLDPHLDRMVAQLRAAQVDEVAIRERIVLCRHASSPAGLVLLVTGGLTALGTAFSLGLSLLLRPSTRPDS